MAKKKTKDKSGSSTIALNKRARHDYFIEDEYEAGLELQGWEVKSLRQGKANIAESFITVKNGECFMFGSTILPLISASTHTICEPTRRRKLLLSRREIDSLIGAIERDGQTIVPLSLYWKGPWVKIKIGTAKGKKLHDKRDTLKDRDWQLQKARVMKRG